MDINLHTLVNDFALISGARVGLGPENPGLRDTQLRQRMQREIRDTLEIFPALNAYPDYVEFLEYYGGASIIRPEEGLIVDIHGPSPECNDLVWEDGDVLFDDQSHFTICFILLPNKWRVDFMLGLTPEWASGIHLAAAGPKSGAVTKWYCSTYSELLSRITKAKGLVEIPM